MSDCYNQPLNPGQRRSDRSFRLTARIPARRQAACGWGSRLLGLGEGQLAVGDVDPDRVAFAELALEHLQRQFVDQLLLDHPLQRPRPAYRGVAEVAEEGAGVLGPLDRDP